MKRVRVLAFLITVCMATTCLLGGTIARYQTSASIDDAATAARWGVTVAAEGSLFGAKYANEANGNNPTDSTDKDIISVESKNSVDLVAPGTKNDKGITFTLTGTPEVDVEIKVSAEITDIHLKAGTYPDYTNDEGMTFAAEAYNPIVFYLKNGNDQLLIKGTLAEVTAYLNGLAGTYESNTNLATIKKSVDNNYTTDGTYVLTWEWIVGDANNKEDTLLGNLATKQTVYTDAVPSANYSTGVSFDITITVEQID